MNVSFRQLRLFLALADSGSVSAAAKAMHVTQPTASMQLKEVTHSVGVPLFEFVGKKLYLTDVGKDLAAYLHQNNMYFYNMDQRQIDGYLANIFD